MFVFASYRNPFYCLSSHFLYEASRVRGIRKILIATTVDSDIVKANASSAAILSPSTIDGMHSSPEKSKYLIPVLFAILEWPPAPFCAMWPHAATVDPSMRAANRSRSKHHHHQPLIKAMNFSCLFRTGFLIRQ